MRIDALTELNKIKKLNDTKRNLLSGTTNIEVPRNKVELITANLSAQAKKIMEASFSGKTKSDSWKPTFKYTPEKKDLRVRTLGPRGGTEIIASKLFKIKEITKGKSVTATCIELDPFYTKQGVKVKKGFNDKACSSGITTDAFRYDLVMSIPKDNPNNIYKDKIENFMYEPVQGDKGFRWRKPAFTKVSLDKIEIKSGQGKEVAKSEMLISQLGIVKSLPASIGFSSSSFSLTYDENTGAITKFGSVAEPINAEALGGVLSSGTDLSKSFKKEKVDKDLENLKKEHDRLKLESEIHTYKETLGLN
jgi:hypothetical protein